MEMSIRGASATIYEFPVRPRRRLDDGRTVAAVSQEHSICVVEQCWYHGDAVKDEAGPVDRPKPC